MFGRGPRGTVTTFSFVLTCLPLPPDTPLVLCPGSVDVVLQTLVIPGSHNRVQPHFHFRTMVRSESLQSLDSKK